MGNNDKYIFYVYIYICSSLRGNKMEKSFSLTVTENELQIIGAGLGKLAYESVAVLINKLNLQVREQLDKVAQETAAGE
jgi:hypothetical protein